MNRALWDGWTEIHERSQFYDIDAFRSGTLTLKPIEIEQVGDVSGKDLLHLQCHFGLDTLSWARKGARVTGVDFSERAIALANSLAAESGLDARFVCADVCDLPKNWTSQFDVVFTSYGVLPWLPDLARWANTIARCLRPGGSFHLIEFHPFATMLDDDGCTLRHPYFHSTEPNRYEVRGSYAEPSAAFTHDAYEWAHGFGDLFCALIAAGLTIHSFREFPFSPYNCFPFLEEREQGHWYVRGANVDVPLVFALHAGDMGMEVSRR
ncbi:MAG: class I SAM-dependent methyltransferase [Longimicrobiales bacterium]